MPMKNPPHPGRLVRRACLEPLALSVTAAEKALRVARPTLSNLLNGKAAISAEMAVRLEKAFGGTADAWLRLQTAYDLAQVRKQEHKIKVNPVAAE